MASPSCQSKGQLVAIAERTPLKCCASGRLSTAHIRERNASVILADHPEPCRARAAYLFENTGPTGRPLHGKNQDGKSGYDGYVTRIFSSLKTPIRSTQYASGGKLRFPPARPLKIPLIAARARSAHEAGF